MLVHLTLPSRAENVAVVRHTLAGVAEALGMDEVGVADLKTIVTEACANVVAHAYPDGEGPLDVTAGPRGESLMIVVRDYGEGIRPRPALDEPSLRLGVPLIAALASSFEIRGGHGLGTEVRVLMDLKPNGAARAAGASAGTVRAVELTTISVEGGALVAPIVSRVIAVLAAQADLSVDRLSDAVLLADAVSAHAPEDFAGGRTTIAIGQTEGAIEVRIGPLRVGAAERMLEAMELPDIGGSLRALADEVTVEPEEDGEGERLLLRIAQR